MPPKDIESNACLVDENGDVIPLESLLNQLVSNLVNNNNIGTKNDFVKVPYTFGTNSVLAHSNTFYYHIHGQPWTYPGLANSITLTSGAGVWNNTGAITEIIPANTLILSAFDIHFANATGISANLEGIIELFSGEAGSEIKIYDVPIVRNTVTSPQNQRRIQINQQRPGTRISARFSDNTAGTNTVNLKLEGHYYGI